MTHIRRLGLGDETLLAMLAVEDEDFDVDERSSAKPPPSAEAMRLYLSDPSVVHWVAEENGNVLGHLHCQVVRKHAGDVELLLYEIGVRSKSRRGGVGRALLDTMVAFMRDSGMTEVWVLADNDGAVEFYAACGFAQPEGMAFYMTREL